MTMTLAYLNDLSRVRIELSALTDGLVRVEQSTNELFWQTVRGGVELPVSAGSAVLDDYEFADGVQNFYRVVPADPPAGLRVTGASGDNASTPDTLALDITGDIDLRIDVTLDNWQPDVTTHLLPKYNFDVNQRSYTLRLNAENNLELVWSTTGTDLVIRTATAQPQPDPDTGRLALRATLDVDDSGDHTVRFYTARSIAGPWSQLGGSRTSDGITSIFNSTADLVVSGANNGTSGNFAGTCHAAEVRNGINGTVVANPDFAAQPTGTLNFVDGAGRTWTVNGSAEIFGTPIETGSVTPSLAGQVWLKSIRYPFLNRTIKLMDDSEPVSRDSRAGVFDVSGRSNPVTVSDVRASQEFTHHIITEGDHLVEVRDLDLILASGDVFLLHIPAGSRIPGGYVTIGPSAQVARHIGPNPQQMISIPCRIVAPPAPTVVGTNLTWGTVFRLYGDWNALINANPTWGDLLATVGSPDDLVVL